MICQNHVATATVAPPRAARVADVITGKRSVSQVQTTYIPDHSIPVFRSTRSVCFGFSAKSVQYRSYCICYATSGARLY